MNVESLAIPEVKLLTPPRYADSRGFFSETWNAARFAAAGVPGPFVQDNHSLSVKTGTIRGLHCQIAPSVQGKLVRVVRGAVWDVAVDIRQGSPTYRAARRGDAERRELVPALDTRRVPARVLHARAEHRGDLQGHRPL